jgi:hypothetical protein
MISNWADIIDDLTYRNYAHNRQLAPSVSPERWEKIYGPQAREMEERYAAEYLRPIAEA